MTAQIIPFPKTPDEDCGPGNGAYEAILAHILQTGCTQEYGEAWVDFVLADLWDRGFQVVPLD